jgi:hypothetical protein
MDVGLRWGLFVSHICSSLYGRLSVISTASGSTIPRRRWGLLAVLANRDEPAEEI